MDQVQDQIDAAAQARIHHSLRQILEDPKWERRAVRRLPYFGPVTLSLQADSRTRFSAFARDISGDGIGLVHCAAVPTGEVVVTLSGEDTPIQLRTEIVWCRNYGNGWFASGGRFLDVVSRSAT